MPARDALTAGLGDTGRCYGKRSPAALERRAGPAAFDVGGFPSTWDQVGVAENCAAAPPREGSGHGQTLKPAQTPGAQPRVRGTTNLTTVAPSGVEPDACCD